MARLGLRVASVLALCAIGCGTLRAACPLDTPQIMVGDTASDAYCNYNDIQSAIDGANAASCPVQINITREHIWGQQHLSVVGKRIIFAGWGDGVTCYTLTQCIPGPDCPRPSSTVPLVYLDGENTPGRVLTISGNSFVTLRHIRILNGEGGSGDGGGIAFDGVGGLNLDTSEVLNSKAAYGAGINFKGNGGNATLNLLANAQVLGNTASVSGGGIRLEGSARMVALAPQTWIANNTAEGFGGGGFGGGVEVLAPARADIGSAGRNGVGVISYNHAVYGGGLSINASDSGNIVRLFTTDADHPVEISNNDASSKGGGVYLDTTGSSSANLCAYDFRINSNDAPDGAAIYADYDPGVFGDDGTNINLNVGFSNDPGCGTPTLPSLGAKDCAATAPCNEIAGNRAVDEFAQPTDGSVVTLASSSMLDGDPVAFRDNQAADVLRLTGETFGEFLDVVLRNCLIADNHTQHELISVRDGRDIGINGCTIAGNTIDSGYSIYANVGDQGFLLVNSIIDQPGRSVLDYSGDNGMLNLGYLIANETFTLGGAPYTQGNTPVYVDAASGDYHLALNSPGLDYAPSQGGFDLDGKPRTVDLATVTNLYGPRDLGAYERQTGTVVDVLFQDGFEF